MARSLRVERPISKAARLSGAHLNPAVTLALAVCNGFPWRKVAGYVAAQMAGGAVAALIVRVLYQDLIAHVDAVRAPVLAFTTTMSKLPDAARRPGASGRRPPSPPSRRLPVVRATEARRPGRRP